MTSLAAGTENQFVTFRLDRQMYALPLVQVERVVRMVAISRVPEAPRWVIGVIDLHGRVVPVLDLRLRFGHPCRHENPDDRLIVVHVDQATVAVVADDVEEVLEIGKRQLEEPPKALARSRPLAAVIRRHDGLALVLDGARILPSDEDWERLRKLRHEFAEALSEGDEDHDNPERAAEAEAGTKTPSTAAGATKESSNADKKGQQRTPAPPRKAAGKRAAAGRPKTPAKTASTSKKQSARSKPEKESASASKSRTKVIVNDDLRQLSDSAEDTGSGTKRTGSGGAKE